MKLPGVRWGKKEIMQAIGIKVDTEIDDAEIPFLFHTLNWMLTKNRNDFERLGKDEKMEEIKASGIDDSQQLRIAILAAMNITDELFTYKKEKKKFVDKVEAKTIAITEFIENRIHDIEADKK